MFLNLYSTLYVCNQNRICHYHGVQGKVITKPSPPLDSMQNLEYLQATVSRKQVSAGQRALYL